MERPVITSDGLQPSHIHRADVSFQANAVSHMELSLQRLREFEFEPVSIKVEQ